MDFLKAFFSFFIFIFGISVGSFLNVLIDRVPQKKKIGGRSFCDHCKKKLLWYDLIPVLSFFLLKGRCRFCRKKISWQYPLVEFFSGFLFLIAFFYFFPKNFFEIVSFLFSLFYLSVLIVIFVTDLKYFLIPDKIIFPSIGIAFFYQLFVLFSKNDFFNFLNSILAGFLSFLFFFLIFFLTRGKGMGFGDAKMALFLGIFLNFPKILFCLLIAFLLGSIISIGLLIGKRKSLTSEIPFGPFLAIGGILALFFEKNLFLLLVHFF